MVIRRIALGTLAVLTLVSCAPRDQVAGTEVAELPGFSIELPFGRVEKSSRIAAAGAHELTLLPRWAQWLPPRLRTLVRPEGTVSVHWRAGPMTPEELHEERELMVSSLARVLGVATPKIAEEDDLS